MSIAVQANTHPAPATQGIPPAVAKESPIPEYMEYYGNALNQYLGLQTPQALEAFKPQLTARQAAALEYWVAKLRQGETPKQYHVSNLLNYTWPVHYGSLLTGRLMWGLTTKLLKKAPIANLTLDQLRSLYAALDGSAYTSFDVVDSGDLVTVNKKLWGYDRLTETPEVLITYGKTGDRLQLVTA